MNFRKAKISDIDNIVLLQEKYLVTNMPESEKNQGFVTTPFSIEQIKFEIAEDSLFVAEADNKIVAYVFVGTWDFFSQWKIFALMAENLPNIKFENKVLDRTTSFQYGPICIDADYRGQGLFEQLFETMRKTLNKRFPVGVTFINKLNKRSFEAHTKKLGLIVVDEFSFNQNEYYTLAFRTDKAVIK
jgi:GNAT superfamily N-acetyltransferase